MTLADVNVLLHAFRSDSPQHSLCRGWLEAVIQGPAAYGISPQVLASVVRISTHPKIYLKPSKLDDVFNFCRVLLSQPGATIVCPQDRHWLIFDELCRKTASLGNAAQDAWWAALAIEWGCEWITLDRDFARFPDLKWRAPTSVRQIDKASSDSSACEPGAIPDEDVGAKVEPPPKRSL